MCSPAITSATEPLPVKLELVSVTDRIPGNSKTVIGQVQVERTGEAEADIPMAVDAEGPGNIDVNDPEET